MINKEDIQRLDDYIKKQNLSWGDILGVKKAIRLEFNHAYYTTDLHNHYEGNARDEDTLTLMYLGDLLDIVEELTIPSNYQLFCEWRDMGK